MDLKALGKAVAGKGLHLLGKALPFGGGLLEMAADALNTDPTPDAVARAIDEDPEAALKLTELQNRHKERIGELILAGAQVDLEAEKARLGDVQSARGREVAVTQATGKRDINLYVLAWTVIIGFFALMTLLIFRPLPEGAEGYVNQLFGTLGTGFGLVLGYFFGSSKSSSDKTALIAAQQNGNGK